MKLRYARHTNNLKLLVQFYVEIIGLEILGSFENHSGYNGVFLGLPDLGWHLEFTETEEKVNHYPDADDLIVFYLESEEKMNAIKSRSESAGLSLVVSKNPYWQKNGIEIKDPDNFGVILTVDKTIL